jgi:hypothetical protein
MYQQYVVLLYLPLYGNKILRPKQKTKTFLFFVKKQKKSGQENPVRQMPKNEPFWSSHSQNTYFDAVLVMPMPERSVKFQTFILSIRE